MTSSNQDISDCDSELDSLNSSHAASTETTAQRKRVRHRFSVWSFQLTISADATALNGGRASDSVTLQEQQKFLLEHVQSRILHTTGMPGIVTFVEAFYDSSILSILSGPNIAGSSILEASERIMWDALRRRPPERLNSCSKIGCLTNSIDSIFSCRRQERRRRFNGRQQSGKRWKILQIGTTLLPRVLHPTHHQAGARLPPEAATSSCSYASLLCPVP